MFESGSCGQLGFFPPSPLFTQSAGRHTRACLHSVFAPETGQVFQQCVLALPPWRHQEAQSVTRPHGASSLPADPPFTSSAPTGQPPLSSWTLPETRVDLTVRTAWGAGWLWVQTSRLGPSLAGFGILEGSVMTFADCGMVPGVQRTS